MSKGSTWSPVVRRAAKASDECLAPRLSDVECLTTAGGQYTQCHAMSAANVKFKHYSPISYRL
jgi:hypothetical protein